MVAAPQICSEPACSAEAIFRSRSKPAWCLTHVQARFAEAGVLMIGEFKNPTTHVLCRCLKCEIDTHIRLAYALDADKREGNYRTACKACQWRSWEAENARIGASQVPTLSGEAIRVYAQANDYDYITHIDNSPYVSDIHLIRCQHCGRQTADRSGDVGSVCPCRQNRRRSNQSTRTDSSSRKNKRLLKDQAPSAAKMWDTSANDPGLWESITFRARQEVAWLCPTCQHRWTESVQRMNSAQFRCPQCQETQAQQRAAWYESFDGLTVADVPELLAAWDDDRISPASILVDASNAAGYGYLFSFRCLNGHHPKMRPLSFLQHGCPFCRQLPDAATVVHEVRSRKITLDPELVAQWHPSANGRVTINMVGPNSSRLVWWQDPHCGFEWEETPARRNGGSRLRCPRCKTILDSLAWHYPELADEWSSSNPVSSWCVRPSTASFVPEWVCSVDPCHIWQASVSARTNGGRCPLCTGTGRSGIEMDHFEAAMEIFGSAKSGVPIFGEYISHRRRWAVDILCPDPLGGSGLVIEYDGSYWHKDKIDTDIAKSMDLLEEGYRVVRLREQPLPSLDIVHPDYCEIPVFSNRPQPMQTIESVKLWAEQNHSPQRAAGR